MGAHSQGTDSVMQFSIKQAGDFSFENQKDVLNSQLDVQIAEYQVKETIGLGLPQISGEFDFKDFFEIPTTAIPGEFFGGEPGSFTTVQFGTQYNASAGLSASQLIFEPSYIVGVQKLLKIYQFKDYKMQKLKLLSML